MSDPIQSYYKQFVSSEHALYFFKFPDENDEDKEISRLTCQIPAGTPGGARGQPGAYYPNLPQDTSYRANAEMRSVGRSHMGSVARS